mmetsp:Transcript_27783/g.60743  ORF Transcript_27783/g.60743 Transcript_27783/m.60743 type:complete len:167 (-) Transcript_27783:69-569(-)
MVRTSGSLVTRLGWAPSSSILQAEAASAAADAQHTAALRRLARFRALGGGLLRTSAAFLPARTSRRAWRFTRILGDRIFYRDLQTVRRSLKAVQCSHTSAPVRGTFSPPGFTQASPTPMESLRLQRALKSQGAGYSVDELRDLCQSSEDGPRPTHSGASAHLREPK